MSRKIFTFFKQCLQKYSLREYKDLPRRVFFVVCTTLGRKFCKNILLKYQFLESFRGKSLQLTILIDKNVIGFRTVHAFDKW